MDPVEIPIENTFAPEVPSARLFRWLAPEIREARARITAIVEDADTHASSVALAELSLARPPLRTLVRIIYRPLILELHASRASGELAGGSSSQRFDAFVESLLDRYTRESLWRKYPGARRESIKALQRWVDHVVTMCVAFGQDRDEIALLFPKGVRLHPTGLDLDSGDSHANGKTVAIIHLGSGERLVYKPRAGLAERAFTAAVDWVNANGFEPALIAVRVCDRTSHSWVRATATRSCESTEEVRQFYQRLGGLIALSYALSITDLHRGNLVAAGAHPVVVDLETLQHSRLVAASRASANRAAVIRDLASSSVLATGLVPTPQLFVEEGNVSQSDVSGMSGDGADLFAQEEPFFLHPDTDEMRVGTRKVPIGSSHHAPEMQGRIQDPSAFEGDILEGFDRMYSVLRAGGERRPMNDSWRGMLRAVESRHITGATEMFSRALWNSFHPDFIVDEGARSRYLKKVLSRHHDVANGSALAASEYRQLLAGDVPIFWSSVGSTSLRGGDGTVIEGVIERLPDDELRDRVASLSEIDHEYQRTVISGAIRSTIRHGSDRWIEAPPTRTKSRTIDLTPRAWAAEEARNIGEALWSTTTWTRGQPQWLTWALHGGTYWMPQPVGEDLYSGRPGIALFLLQLDRVSGDRRFRAPAEAILSDEPRSDGPSLGLTGVWEARIALAHSWAELTGDASPLEDEIARAAPSLQALLAADETFDVVGGAAGTLMLLTSIPVSGSARVTVNALLREAIARLHGTARSSDAGTTWVTPTGPRGGMTGFSHGNAGIALALMRATSALDPLATDSIAADAMRWESNLFDKASGNWPDLRSAGGSNLTAWCHGAPGIALARAGVPEQYRTLETQLDMERGVRAITAPYLEEVAVQRLDDLSLCHGALGNLMILDQLLCQLPPDSARRSAREQLLADVQRSVIRHGYTLGAPSGLSPSDLMTGFAGVGYGLLSAADPGSVPDLPGFGTVRTHRVDGNPE